MTVIDWNALQQQAAQAMAAIPAGDYDMVVSACQYVTSSTGKPMYKTTMRVETGPLAGKSFINNFVLSGDNPNALRMFFRQLATLGLDANFFANNPTPETVANALVNRRARVSLKTRTWNGEERNEMQGISPPLGTTPTTTVTTANPPLGATPTTMTTANPAIVNPIVDQSALAQTVVQPQPQVAVPQPVAPVAPVAPAAVIPQPEPQPQPAPQPQAAPQVVQTAGGPIDLSQLDPATAQAVIAQLAAAQAQQAVQAQAPQPTATVQSPDVAPAQATQTAPQQGIAPVIPFPVQPGVPVQPEQPVAQQPGTESAPPSLPF
jgi:hypothetical protein